VKGRIIPATAPGRDRSDIPGPSRFCARPLNLAELPMRSSFARSRRVVRRPAARPTLEPLEDRPLMGVLAGGFLQTNLVSDQADAALITDPQLINAWGIGLAPSTGNFWVSDNGADVTTLYSGDVAGTPFAKNSLVVSIPGGAPTGQLFNGTGNFIVHSGTSSGSSLFVFATETGWIDGWNPAVPPPSPSTAAQTGAITPNAVYKGVALASNAAGDFLYAANFRAGTIDVFDKNFTRLALPGAFVDPNLPAGFAPFNIQNLGGKLYVTYAKQDAARHDDVAGPGNGFVDVFDTGGNLIQRLIIGNPGSATSPVNSPWGLAIAPAGFGTLGGDLLVGNFGDGRINVFNPSTGASIAALSDAAGRPFVIDGLWGLTFGNGMTAGDASKLYFAAGPGGEQHGRFGSLQFGATPLAATGVSLTVEEGTFTGTVAAFGSTNSMAVAGDFTATISWGDGTTSAGTVSATGNGSFNVSGTYLFSEEGPRTVGIALLGMGTQMATASTTIHVNEPALTLHAGQPLTGIEGTDLGTVTVATFTHGDGTEPAAAFTARTAWGDGTTSTGTVVVSAGLYSVQGSHTYADEGSFTITVAISEESTTVTMTTTAQVREVLLPDGSRGTANQRFLSEVYHDLLGRGIDPVGLAGWGSLLDGGTTRAQVVLDIESGSEFRTREVTLLFGQYLKRLPSQQNLDASIAFLNSGGTVERLASFLTGSAEYFHTQASDDPGKWADAIFQDTLHNAPPPTVRATIVQAEQAGIPRDQIFLQLVGTDEYRQVVVQLLYSQLLDRAADPAGLDLFVGLLRQGMRDEDVASIIAGTDEYFAKTAP
jgi:uncharacterized protein (TIGR03118 family)